ncbi:RagB/SusD family nutrient uptake outer membrane protein [Pedobacter foliorum]|uniref:RagB/SusD family nutrient uptake outer membrane protein n=1 Tax=Pedobacter foliorum TaxID=2739058 RepID=UPI00156615D3|nr:RagB/SusD family nutrient uptake outer membrane protein [Pedobacter foliorum]NRF37580.1 RagB/SusD family nutrient uptake outer membrane protein [Pedobacter foliorum]
MKNLFQIMIIGLLAIFNSGCKKLVEIDGPITNVSSKDVFSTDATAIGAITNLYAKMASLNDLNGTNELPTLSCIAGLSADELTLFRLANNTQMFSLYQNSLTSSKDFTYWSAIYSELYIVNSALEGISISNSLTPEVKQQLLGEAKFMRAFYYFYLVNLYGDVPLVINTDYTINASIKKSSKSKVYEQIIADLTDAQNLLSDRYLKIDCITPYPIGSEERLRPTKWAAISLLARTYLYTGNWGGAESQASKIIENTAQFHLESLDKVFLKNNAESIWQLQSVNEGVNTFDARTFLLPVSGPGMQQNPVYLYEGLVNNFDDEDQRKNMWINSVVVDGIIYYYPYKYKVPPKANTNTSFIPITEYSMVMRLAEQFLIRAEARTQNNNLEGAVLDVDKIRERAGLAATKSKFPNITKSELLELISKERQLELFTEWGHRWFDLKRTGKIDEVMAIMTPKKGNTSGWKSYQQYYPISIDELKKNPNLMPTPGY